MANDTKYSSSGTKAANPMETTDGSGKHTRTTPVSSTAPATFGAARRQAPISMTHGR